MPEADTTPPDPETPCPPRFYWLKRLALAGLVLAVLLVGLRLVWGHRVQGRLDLTIADIQSRGESILFDDLQSEPLPDSENGAWYLKQALAQWPVVPNNPGLRITDTDWYNEGEEAGYTDPITDNAAYLRSCEAVFDLLREAEQCEQADWGTVFVRPVWMVLLPHLGESRELARLVDDAVERALTLGEMDFVFEAMLLQRAIARHVSSQHHIFLIDYLVGLSIANISIERIERCLPQIDPSALREGRARELAKQAIAQLTDDYFFESLVRAMIGERASNYDFYECLIDGTVSAANAIGTGEPIEWMIDTPGVRHVILPAIKNEQFVTTQVITQIIKGLRDNLPASEIEQIEADITPDLYSNALLYPLQGAFFGTVGQVSHYHRRNQAFRHCAATAIAIRLYEADYGQRPDKLSQLVPNYLPSIPVDPYSPTGESIRYNREGIVPGIDSVYRLSSEQVDELKRSVIRPYPVVYSIGMDSKDSNGQFMIVSDLGELDDTRWHNNEDDHADIWFLLDAWPEAVFDESEFVEDSELPF